MPAAPLPLPVAPPRSLSAGLVHWTRIYAELAKVRLVALVVVTATVGFVMAAGASPASSLSWTLLGVFVSASGSMALNEWLEVDRDRRMRRTERRPLPTAQISGRHALAFGLVAVAVGMTVLGVFTTPLATALDALVVATYVLVYTPLKTRSTLCTLAGAVCGALPPMIGWAAASGSLALGAWLLGGVLFLWQIPHFLSLAWLYRDDYERGGFRMLPLVDRTGSVTVLVVVLYTLALLPLGAAPVLAGMAGLVYGVASLLLGAGFLALALRLARSRSTSDARKLFLASLAYLPLLLGLMVADRRPVAREPGFRLIASHGPVAAGASTALP